MSRSLGYSSTNPAASFPSGRPIGTTDVSILAMARMLALMPLAPRGR